MTLWAAQYGFLSAKPKGSDQTRAELHGWDLPEIPAGGQFYIDQFQRAGVADTGGMSLQPLKFAEIRAACPWADMAEIDLMRNMSKAYVDGSRKTDPFARSPVEMDGT